MIDALSAWDRELLLRLHLAGQEPWDTLMYYATKSWVWTPLFIGWGYFLHRTHGKKFIRWVVFTLLVVGLTDFICSQGLKPWVRRLRPSHEPSVRPYLHLVRGYAGGPYGFPSNHAANSAAMALAISLALRQGLIILIAISWAALHSYTRLYLGVHYPSDILAGWGIGITFTLLAYLAAKRKHIL